jgi:hypothetical protein
VNSTTIYTPEVAPPSAADAHGTERVWAAAIRFAGRAWVAPCHIDATALAAEGTSRPVREVWAESVPQGQGFITTRRHFISRADAWVIAEREGQLGPEIVVRGELHSEDLARGHFADGQREAA